MGKHFVSFTNIQSARAFVGKVAGEVSAVAQVATEFFSK
jgi:hypothetical protein